MLCITYIESLSNQTVLRRLYFVFGIWMIFWIWIVLWSYVRFWHASSIVQKSYLLNLAAQEYYAFGVLMREKSGLIFWPRYFLFSCVWSAKVLMQWDKYKSSNHIIFFSFKKMNKYTHGNNNTWLKFVHKSFFLNGKNAWKYTFNV